MRSKHTFLEHTADVRLKASGESLPVLFSACLRGMNELLKPGFCDEENPLKEEEKIDLKADDPTILLIDFLSEVLTLSYIHNVLYCECRIDKMTDHEISGTLKGRPAENFDQDIKAVTYHEADIQLNEDGDLETIVVFDI